MKSAGYVIMLAVCWAATGGVWAGRPTEQIRASAEKIIAVLNDAGLKSEARKGERRRVIRQELRGRFDWAGIARGCLGRHWAKRSPDEQIEFVELFSRFLEQTYLDKIEPYYGDLAKIDYQGEKIIENYASVRTVVSTKAKIDHPVEYRLEKSPTEDIWRVYDVVIEGVSLVRNYRVQFDEMIAKTSFEALIKDIKAKLDPSWN